MEAILARYKADHHLDAEWLRTRSTKEKPSMRLEMPLNNNETFQEAEDACLEYMIFLRKTYGFNLVYAFERVGYFSDRRLVVFMRIVVLQGQEIPSST